MKTSDFVILDAGLNYVLLVCGTKSVHKAKLAVCCSWPLFYREGKQVWHTHKATIVIP